MKPILLQPGSVAVTEYMMVFHFREFNLGYDLYSHT